MHARRQPERRAVRSNPLAEWFMEPVNHVELGLVDYPTVITTPMDLGTIHKKMERSQYMSVEDFAHDVRLVWQNAITYNSPHSMIGVTASILAQICDRRFALITRSATADPGRPIPDRHKNSVRVPPSKALPLRKLVLHGNAIGADANELALIKTADLKKSLNAHVKSLARTVDAVAHLRDPRRAGERRHGACVSRKAAEAAASACGGGQIEACVCV